MNNFWFPTRQKKVLSLVLTVFVFASLFVPAVSGQTSETFTIRYNGNGADSGKIADQTSSGTEVTLKKNETANGDRAYVRQGCSFLGWSMKESISEGLVEIIPGGSTWAIDDEAIIHYWNKNIPGYTLYAWWNCPNGTPVPTKTATNVPTATATKTPVPTATKTPVPTATNTLVPTATNTPVPSATQTPVPTATATAVPTKVNTIVPTIIFTATKLPADTATAAPVITALPENTATDIPTDVPTAVPATATSIPTELPTEVPTDVPTSTPVPPTATPLPTATKESYFKIENGVLSRYTGTDSVVTIPSTVTKIGDNAFTGNPYLTKVTIPSNVKEIGSTADASADSVEKSAASGAFAGCAKLERVLITGNGLEKIGDGTFAGCDSLAVITIPRSVSAIGADVFPASTVVRAYQNSYAAVWAADNGQQLNLVDQQSERRRSTSDNDEFFSIGGDDVTAAPAGNHELPRTGITGKTGFARSEMPASVNYLPVLMELQIPTLNVMADILSVEAVDGDYPVEWLEMSAGLLADTALPGQGISVIAAHNTVNAEEYGPFVLISAMQLGDRFFVRDADNRLMIFEVYHNEKIDAYDYDALYDAAVEYDSTITLLTCEDELAEGGYASRRIVTARQVL